jgi:plasmid stability protein
MPKQPPKPGHRTLAIENFPDALRQRLAVVAAQQQTTIRAIVLNAVTEAVEERERWQREERAATEPGVVLRDGWHPARP